MQTNAWQVFLWKTYAYITFIKMRSLWTVKLKWLKLHVQRTYLHNCVREGVLWWYVDSGYARDIVLPLTPTVRSNRTVFVCGALWVVVQDGEGPSYTFWRTASDLKNKWINSNYFLKKHCVIWTQQFVSHVWKTRFHQYKDWLLRSTINFQRCSFSALCATKASEAVMHQSQMNCLITSMFSILCNGMKCHDEAGVTHTYENKCNIAKITDLSWSQEVSAGLYPLASARGRYILFCAQWNCRHIASLAPRDGSPLSLHLRWMGCT